MKIVYLASGAAGMYCGTCLHDNTLARALLAGGDEVLLMPTYTPLRTDETDVSQHEVMLGGINMYLQQALPLFRYTPRWLDRWFDSAGLLGWLARMQFSVQAEKLGALTVSVVRGEQGHQHKEVERLVHWLADEVQPAVVHLSNALLIGLARPIKQRLGVPVVCSLSGEDIFFDKLAHPYREQTQQEIRARAEQVDAFVALNRYYAVQMAEYMAVDAERIHVIPHGLDLTGHQARTFDAARGVTRIGYLARICHDKGLHLLVEAFERLAADGSLPELELHAAGYLGKADRAYLRQQQDRLRRAGLADRFHYQGELSRDEKIRFLHSLDVMSVPAVYRESKGLSLLESLANGVPLVVPNHGTCPELIADTGGGLLFEAGQVDDLVRALRQYIDEPHLAAEHGRQGHAAIGQRYHAQQMAQRTRALYQRLCGSSDQGRAATPQHHGAAR